MCYDPKTAIDLGHEVFPTRNEADSNKTRVAALRKSIAKPSTTEELAFALEDVAAIDAVSKGAKEGVFIGFSPVVHRRYKWVGKNDDDPNGLLVERDDGEPDPDENDIGKWSHGAHLSTPALLHCSVSERSMGSGNPFSYGHYHDATLAPAIYAACCGVAGAAADVPTVRELAAALLFLAEERGGVLAPMREDCGKFERECMERLKDLASGRKSPSCVPPSIYFPAPYLMRPAMWRGTVDALRLALEDTTGTVFQGEAKTRLVAWAESSELAFSVPKTSSAKKPPGVL